MTTKQSLIKEIGERLRIARIRAGYKTIQSFISDYKIAKSTYTQYETGMRALPVNLLLEFSSLLKTNLTWLLTGQGPIEIIDRELFGDASDQLSQNEFLSILEKSKTPLIQKSRKSASNKFHRDEPAIFSDILSRIMQCYRESSLTFDTETVAELTFGIYLDVIEKASNEQEQKNLIEASISTFNRTLKFREQRVG